MVSGIPIREGGSKSRWFLDLSGQSVTVRDELEPMMTPCRRSVCQGARGVAIIMAVLVLVFCLSSVAAASAETTGCRGPDPSPRMCAPSGPAGSLEQIVAVVDEIPSGKWEPASLGFASTPAVEGLSRLHVEPSVPRAPPFLLV